MSTSTPDHIAPTREIREIVREEPYMRNRILKLLEDGALTIPEIAQALGSPTAEVTYWVMGMRKYGYVREEKEVSDEGYYRYQAIEREIG
jgi:predicted transcriptional regulator